jgi:thioredoxin-like negative regulator of GroEL
VPDGAVLAAAAEEALDTGDAAAAREGLLAAAAAYRRTGRPYAAIDACYLALAVAPADADLHVMLAEIYLESGWRAPAVDKLLLLGRLAELDEDPGTRQRLCLIVRDQLADEPRLVALCA